MHKSWGNAIDFDEAADRMGVDVMRWMFIKARPEDNILFGWHAADESRRELLVLWNVYSFFVTYARLAGWTPGRRTHRRSRNGPILDRWILSRAAGTRRPRWRTGCRTSIPLARPARCRATSTASRPGISGCRGGGSRARATRPTGPSAFATLHEALTATARMLAPILPFLADSLYQNLVASVQPDAPDSVHLTRWPSDGSRRPPRPEGLETAMAGAQGAVDLARTLAEHGAPQEPAAAGPGVDRVAGPWLGDRRRPAPAHRRRDQCQDRHRDRRRLDPCRTTGEAAAAEDREASRIGDPGGHGRGAERRRRVRRRTAR